MPAPDNLKHLVENFHRNIDNYRSGKYNETQVANTQRQIEAVDGQIDGLVYRQIDNLIYKLYNLSDEEIGIVEKASQT